MKWNISGWREAPYLGGLQLHLGWGALQQAVLTVHCICDGKIAAWPCTASVPMHCLCHGNWLSAQQSWLRQRLCSDITAVQLSRQYGHLYGQAIPLTPVLCVAVCLQHHREVTSHVATVMSSNEHAVLAARAAGSPLFVLPLRKASQGFCSLLIQWQPQQALVTTLAEYRQMGSSAPAHFAMTCYTELASSHGLVLLRGDVLRPELVNTAEARTVMELTRALYTDASSYQMVYKFNHAPDTFDFGLLLQQLGISSGQS
ncbi:ATP11 protein-domain-containing protein [Scenedesmus sp. NREL 46B-D3]|nr:ATP11 protein-domain-containing protein [Scenedesmus sp. NREL 46B-D3]